MAIAGWTLSRIGRSKSAMLLRPRWSSSDPETGRFLARRRARLVVNLDVIGGVASGI